MNRTAFVALLAACCTLHAAPNRPQPLERVQFFAVGPVSEAARTSDGELGLRALLAQPDAKAKLQRLIDSSASTPSQLYALLGLRIVDTAAFAQSLPSFTTREDRVSVMTGCIVSHESVRSVAQKIAQGDYDDAFRRPAR